mmetsp:Transcript_41778/g.108194  ORF Transcript_41778/g.108194 Transcript_41778/m.108194 type:complete len:221 (+) Transcript_41778:167-829(+)
MPRLPVNKCLGFQSGMWWSASPFLPCFSSLRIFFLRTFSATCAASSDFMPLAMLALLPRSIDLARLPSAPSSSPPAVASRFRLLASVTGLEVERPRILDASLPCLVSSFSTSSTLFRTLRFVGSPFLDLLSLFSRRRWRTRLCTSSRTTCVSRNSSMTFWSSASLFSAISKASSRSSSASFLSISGSTKSMTFFPSMISGMTSYFHESSSSKDFLQRSTE